MLSTRLWIRKMTKAIARPVTIARPNTIQPQGRLLFAFGAASATSAGWSATTDDMVRSVTGSTGRWARR